MGYNTVLQSGGWAPKLQRYSDNVFLRNIGPPYQTSGVPRNFFRGGGGSINSVEDREDGDLGAVAP